MKTPKKSRTGDTVRMKRPLKVFTDVVGGSSWMSEVEPCELELDGEQASSTDPYNSCRLRQLAT